MSTTIEEHDRLDSAAALIDRIGGFNGNGADDLAATAIAEALVGIGYELSSIALSLARLADTQATVSVAAKKENS